MCERMEKFRYHRIEEVCKRATNMFRSIGMVLPVFVLVLSSCSRRTQRAVDPGKLQAVIGPDTARIVQAIRELDTAGVPHFWVDINLHFVAHREYGTFRRGAPGNEDVTNGLHWARLLINHANWALDSLGRSPSSLRDFEGDAHYNYRLYSDAGNLRDSFGGIWFWEPDQWVEFPYGERVLNVVLVDDGKRMLNGSACGFDFCNSVKLYGAWHNVRFEGKFGWWAFASLLNHETGHVFGLCHSFYCGNECAGIDLDPAVECHSGPCFDDCGGPNNGSCNNWLANSNNMMGYNANQNALTPCQWQRLIGNMCRSKAFYLQKRTAEILR